MHWRQLCTHLNLNRISGCHVNAHALSDDAAPVCRAATRRSGHQLAAEKPSGSALRQLHWPRLCSTWCATVPTALLRFALWCVANPTFNSTCSITAACSGRVCVCAELLRVCVPHQCFPEPNILAAATQQQQTSTAACYQAGQRSGRQQLLAACSTACTLQQLQLWGCRHVAALQEHSVSNRAAAAAPESHSGS